MDVLSTIKKALGEILDIEEDIITPETYIARDLGAESIDLLELGVALNSSFHIKIIDDEIFLGSLRLHLTDANESGEEPISYISKQFPFLSSDRIKELLDDLKNGPVLQVKDLVSYVNWKL